ncbi:hypothetical protein LEP1GSC082_3390 [Leptospira kirschneri str. H2]|uniref:Uncharacterized protein n=1 Tax=Leptospira kirschneri str. H1 TaxID=1049966 RepID=A0A0E2B417_9LEPT|nr:hypothetical protein [Leptospira kirschneri]EKO15900.1 hypothetical protein LEP1GSC081_3394 [Leptospira kirschneri str. H1]EKO61459.1 hypothetical protein LEP1GSC082_3390 [Leptospira kirschneri str. H2]UML82101.1 hypothetical protein FH602_11390 [Leptospira kirschneri]
MAVLILLLISVKQGMINLNTLNIRFIEVSFYKIESGSFEIKFSHKIVIFLILIG